MSMPQLTVEDVLRSRMEAVRLCRTLAPRFRPSVPGLSVCLSTHGTSAGCAVVSTCVAPVVPRIPGLGKDTTVVSSPSRDRFLWGQPSGGWLFPASKARPCARHRVADHFHCHAQPIECLAQTAGSCVIGLRTIGFRAPVCPTQVQGKTHSYTMADVFVRYNLQDRAIEGYWQHSPASGFYCIYHRRKPGQLHYDPNHEGARVWESMSSCSDSHSLILCCSCTCVASWLWSKTSLIRTPSRAVLLVHK
jgi:hypothetical protein